MPLGPRSLLFLFVRNRLSPIIIFLLSYPSLITLHICIIYTNVDTSIFMAFDRFVSLICLHISSENGYRQEQEARQEGQNRRQKKAVSIQNSIHFSVVPSLIILSHCSVDPFTKKEWYEIKAPGIFSKRLVGLTPVTRTTGTSK